MEASEEVRAAARRIGDVFGVPPQVLRFRAAVDPDGDGEEPPEVSIAVGDGCPAPGYASYATLDMERFPTNVTTEDGRPIRTELITVGRADYRLLSDVLAQCAFQIASGSLHVTPNTIVPNAVHAADPDRSTRHVLLVVPFIWSALEILVERDEDVTTWLQAVPITDAELQFASRLGADELFTRLESAGADVSDIDRPSVV
ncbi:suppressor of fused domain protein [Rhodococcus sp. AG1013]|uniref:suppressor of fused domain protein n=1 Tax=unclassified Rhodococcus (in: high G+C Gram-positive bacteria) TaxID=192944 RepID=UPI000E0AA6EC|nr:suppressor of fused domain protein [Rhodococcus sp. AG1013]RDI26946.1 suppressor of fused protein SUFU [Rhodococcus sp. AG1013]